MIRNPFTHASIREALDTIGAAVSLALFFGTLALWLVVLKG